MVDENHQTGKNCRRDQSRPEVFGEKQWRDGRAGIGARNDLPALMLRTHAKWQHGEEDGEPNRHKNRGGKREREGNIGLRRKLSHLPSRSCVLNWRLPNTVN